MSDTTTQGDEAAIAAAAGFWNENPDLEAKAAAEVPDVPAQSQRANAALTQEYADQQAELEQGGEMEPGEADGIPAEKTAVTETKQAPTGKPATAVATPVVESGVDPVLRDIAKDAGWTDAKIDRLYKADPELAVETFEQLADSYVNLSRQFLEPAPGTTPAAVKTTSPAQVPVQPTQAASQLPALLTDEALAKFADENGEQAANLIKMVRDHFVAQNTALDQRVQKFEVQAQQAETRAVAEEAKTVIGQLQKQFPKVYGASEDPKALTMGQYQKQVELANLADQIRAGALAQGRTISVKDAIKRAHYIVSRDSVKAEARQEIVGAIQRRSRAVTARPTQRTNPAAAGQSKGDEAALAAYAERAAEIYGDE